MKCQIIRGATRLVGLLGHPVAHSLSPIIHNHAFSSLDLPYAYVPLDVAPENLEKAVSFLRISGFTGANVTIPHKQAIIPLCDVVSEMSRKIGSVNTLYFEDGRLCGTTTDVQGFFMALAHMDHDPSGGDIIILGNGGTARTLGFALALDKKPRCLTIVGRSEDKVSHLAEDISRGTKVHVDHLLFSSPALKDRTRQATLLINATSAGMHPHSTESPLPADYFNAATTVFDTIYNPDTTLFLHHAERAGCRCQNGLRMLLNQALASFKIWTGVEVPSAIFLIDELAALVQ